MLQSKLLILLKALNRKEKALLNRFVNSPVYNQHKEVIALSNYLLSLQDFTERNTSKQRVYAHLFPKSKYDDLRLRHVCSYLLQVCESCLGFIEYQNNAEQHQLNLLSAYRKHALQKHFVNDFLLVEKSTLVESKKNTNYFLYHSKIFHEAQFSGYYERLNSLDYLKKSDENLTLFIVLNKLKNGCYLLSSATANTTPKPVFIEEALSFAEQYDLNKLPILDCYYCAYRAFEYPDQRPFFTLFKDKIASLAVTIEHEELKEMLGLAVRFCERRIEEGASVFERDLFEIYLLGLANEAFIENEKLGYSFQKKIIDLGLRLSEYEWVLAFINECNAINEKALKEDIFLLHTAKLHFAQSTISDCLQKLCRLSNQSLELQIEAQKLVVKSYENLKDSKQEKLANQQLKQLIKKAAVNYEDT
ncbi:MAG: hypothetical protein IPP56_04090 [Bacteroidetes bacterium]|nr:hypothetical protein [Bacteroidota bacterium]MBK9798929.1 hypothetical protein [Bacteroidota bacterium]